MKTKRNYFVMEMPPDLKKEGAKFAKRNKISLAKLMRDLLKKGINFKDKPLS
jgi:hypothetical protein